MQRKDLGLFRIFFNGNWRNKRNRNYVVISINIVFHIHSLLVFDFENVLEYFEQSVGQVLTPSKFEVNKQVEGKSSADDCDADHYKVKLVSQIS